MSETSAAPVISEVAPNRRDLNGKNGLFQRKNKKRRRRRKKTAGSDNTSGTERGQSVHSSSSFGGPRRKRRQRRRGRRFPVLRPMGMQVPRAPENSTQFIMDVHENSVMFMDFEDDLQKRAKTQDEVTENECQDVNRVNNTAPWQSYYDYYPYDVADFESTYRSVKEDRLMGLTEEDLKEAIKALEARASVLADALSASPSRIIARLQSQLLLLQKKNKSLLANFEKNRNSERSSSTESDSESDSSSDTSECSDYECETCRNKRRKTDEEKENTRPSSPECEIGNS